MEMPSRLVPAPPPSASDIVTLWHGGRLGRVRRLCLSSQLRLGYRVTVFTYRDVEDLPAGITLKDASSIMPETFADKIRPGPREWMTWIQFSDFFRMRLMRLGLGVWLDTDVYLLRPMTIDPELPYFAWESFWHIGNSALYLPPDHPIVAAYEELGSRDVLFSNNLALHHRLIGCIRKMTRKNFNPADIRLGIYGPAALTACARRHGATRFAAGAKLFYRIHSRPRLFFEPWDFRPLLADPGIVGLHISPKMRTDEVPLKGSLYEWAERHINEATLSGAALPH